MADEEAAVAEEQPKSKKKLFIIVGVVLALAAGGYFFLMGGGGGEEMAAEEMAEPEVVEGEVVEVGTMTVVLADEGESLRYARIGLALVLSDTADSTLVGSKVSLIQDAAITVLSDMTSEDLRGASGAEDARARLTAAAQEIYPDGDVIRVVLTEMILQ